MVAVSATPTAISWFLVMSFVANWIASCELERERSQLIEVNCFYFQSFEIKTLTRVTAAAAAVIEFW